MLEKLQHIAIPSALLATICLVNVSCTPRLAVKKEQIAAVVEQEPVMVESKLGHARTYFRRNEYDMALLSLAGVETSSETLLIAGEANFRLGRYKLAKPFFEQIVKETKNPIERRKAQIRLFDIDIRDQNIQSATERYVAYSKAYKKTTAQMKYSLGKELYDLGYPERAEKILRGIAKGNEFFLRARYIVAALNMGKNKPDANAKIFAQIEEEKPVASEDYVVHQLAILAQGRILAQAGRFDQAEKAYARVNLAGEFGETATSETVRMALTRASDARVGHGQFKELSLTRRKDHELQAIEVGLRAIERYRKFAEIDWRKPELLTVMARLMVETKRYDDARLGYQELIQHYRRVYQEMSAYESTRGVWPYFALDFDRDSDKPVKLSMIEGVPDSLVRDLPDVRAILALRDRIEASDKKLSGQIERSLLLLGRESDAILAARRTHNAIVAAYNKMVIKKQKKLAKAVAEKINSTLQEAEFKRAELVVLELEDLKKQQNVIHDYQSEKIDAFSEQLKGLDEGGSP